MPSKEAIESAKAIMQGKDKIETDRGVKSLTGLANWFDEFANRRSAESDKKLFKACTELDVIHTFMFEHNRNEKLGITVDITAKYRVLREIVINIAMAVKLRKRSYQETINDLGL